MIKKQREELFNPVISGSKITISSLADAESSSACMTILPGFGMLLFVSVLMSF